MPDLTQPTPLSRKEKKFNKLDEYLAKHYTTETNSLYTLLQEQAKEKRDGIFSRRQGANCKISYNIMGSIDISFNEFSIDDLDEYIEETDVTFQEKLLEYIDRMGIKDSEFYNSLNLSKQMFSKLRSNKFYQPSRNTVMASCIRLRLNLTEANDLMGRAGFAFSPNNKADMVVKGCIEHKIYDVELVEDYLQSKDIPTLLKY